MKAQLDDAFFAEDLPETLKQALGAKVLQVSRSGTYSRAALSRLRGFERPGPTGYADVIIERWDLPEGAAVQVTFRPKVTVAEARTSAVFSDYIYFDEGWEVQIKRAPRAPGHYYSPEDFSVGFYCSGPGTEHKVLVGVPDWLADSEYRLISRRAHGFDGRAPIPTGTVRIQPGAPWGTAAHSPPASYPARALLLEREGSVRLTCRLGAAGKLVGCEVDEEQPKGWGFATEALSWSEQATLQALKGGGEDVVQAVSIGLKFSIGYPDLQCPALRAPRP